MAATFFIKRPKFAIVIAIICTLAGLISIPLLPIAEYPQVTPPQIVVSAVYPGANAATVRDSIASIIEDKVNGVENMIYMSSKCGNDGSYALTVTFAIGSDSKLAEVAVNNRVNQSMAQLPDVVKQQGVITKEKGASIALVVNLFSPNSSFDGLYLSNFSDINVKGELLRIPGVSEVTILGELKYAMRVWLDPTRLASLQLTSGDILNSIREQNIQIAPGGIGMAPSPEGQPDSYTLVSQGRLQSVEEFENIVVRTSESGEPLRLGQIARIELGAQTYFGEGKLNGKDSAVLALYTTPSANIIDVSTRARELMNKLSKTFPDDLEQTILYDTATAVKVSIDSLVVTLGQALALVVIVVWIFIQDWRATLVPALAIPVSLIGTFAFMYVSGMTINTTSLFALILAIGVVVDDAIVVVENTQRYLGEGLTPRQAVTKTMEEVTGPVISTTLVLLAVFVPVTLMPGLTGRMYQQFALTISIAVCISSINALSLSPALCKLLLRKPTESTFFLFRWFNSTIDGTRSIYVRTVQFLGKRLILSAMFYGLVILGMLGGFMSLPTGFIPLEDKGSFMMDVELPPGSSIQRTNEAVAQLQKVISEQEGVADVISISGFSVLKSTMSPDSALVIIVLKDWSERTTRELNQFQILRKVQGVANSVLTANARAFPLPPIPGLGITAGQELVLQDRKARSSQELESAMNAFIVKANERPELQKTYGLLRSNNPQYHITVDRNKAKALGLRIDDVYATMSNFLAGSYVNDFNRFGKVYQVKMQADGQHRSTLDDINNIYVKNKNGEMVILSNIITVKPVFNPAFIDRYNLFNSAMVNSSPAPGYSSGNAIAALEELATETLPDGYSIEWTGMTYQEISAGNLAPILFGLAFIFVYLFLVAQYESWSVPVAVLMAVPVALLGAALGIMVIKVLGLNFFAQVGLILLIGLSTKTAILIVEFAKQLREEEGKSIIDATVTAAKLRYRAVLMTALSFLLGVLPLLLATGCGASSQLSLGFAVFGGMLLASTLGTILIPVSYALIQTIREKFKGSPDTWEKE